MSAAAANGEAGFAAALLDPALPVPGELRSWNGSDTAGRFAIYRNNVVSSLVDALAETFPVVLELVGDEFFRAMASVFVRHHPPRSRLLTHFGEGFAQFVQQFEPVRAVPYLADVARLEQARVLSFHCADAPVVTPDQVGAALSDTDRIGQLRVEWHPSLTIIESEYAIVSLFAAHQGIVDIGAVDPSLAETAVVVRTGFDVVVLHAPAGTAVFVAACRRGDALRQAAGAAARADPGFDLSKVLGLLNSHGAIRSIHLPSE